MLRKKNSHIEKEIYKTLRRNMGTVQSDCVTTRHWSCIDITGQLPVGTSRKL